MGVYEHKIIKNRFASDFLLEYILPMQTVGVLREDRARKVRELAVPMGVVGAIIPTTNPTSTAIYKAMISVKARNAIVMSPHPRATKSVVETARVLEEAALGAGAPPGLINSMTVADARRHERADAAQAHRGHPRDGRLGHGARGVRRGQAGVRRRPRQRARHHRANGAHRQGGCRRRRRQDVRCRRALLGGELRRL